MLKNKSYYEKILNELIPKSKKNNFLNFCECVDIEKFFKDIELIDFKSYAIISKKKMFKKKSYSNDRRLYNRILFFICKTQ